MVERQIKRMEYEKRLLEKQKIMFDFNVNVRKRMIEAQRRWYEVINILKKILFYYVE